MAPRVKVTITLQEEDRKVKHISAHESDALTANELCEMFRDAGVAFGYAESNIAEALVEVGNNWTMLHKSEKE